MLAGYLLYRGGRYGWRALSLLSSGRAVDAGASSDGVTSVFLATSRGSVPTGAAGSCSGLPAGSRRAAGCEEGVYRPAGF